MADLRDRLDEFEAAAARLLARPMRPQVALVYARPARCHPDRPLLARDLCRNCYTRARGDGTLFRHRPKRTIRTRADFIADYELLRSEGHTRRQIAERLGMSYPAVTGAYGRAVADGDLTPDRRLA